MLHTEQEQQNKNIDFETGKNTIILPYPSATETDAKYAVVRNWFQIMKLSTFKVQLFQAHVVSKTSMFSNLVACG